MWLKNLSLPASGRLFESCSWISENQLGWLCDGRDRCATSGLALSKRSISVSNQGGQKQSIGLHSENLQCSRLNKMGGHLAQPRMLALNLEGTMALSALPLVQLVGEISTGSKLAGRVSPPLYAVSCYFLASAEQAL